MNKFILLSILGVLAFLSISEASPQITPKWGTGYIGSSLWHKSAFIQKLFLELVATLQGRRETGEIREPLKFENFSFVHDEIFETGTSLIGNPQVHGWSSKANLTTEIDRENKIAKLRITVPEVWLTGNYDCFVDRIEDLWNPNPARYRGIGSYNHSFQGVEFWLNMTIVENPGAETRKIKVGDIHASLTFQTCNLWAENFSRDGFIWDELKFQAVSSTFKYWHELRSFMIDLVVGETAAADLNIYWGWSAYDLERALADIIGLESTIA